jgi:hypothetical protein
MACCSASVNPWVAEPLDRPAGALVEDLHQPLHGLGTWALPVDGSRPSGRDLGRVTTTTTERDYPLTIQGGPIFSRRQWPSFNRH